MKHCMTCQFHDRAATPVGNGHMQMVDICTNPECSNPVDATPLPCVVVRKDTEFCGIRARFYKKKETEPAPEGQVIQLPT